MFQIGTRKILSPDDEEIEVMRAQFAEHGGLKLPNLIESGLAATMAEQLEGAAFYHKIHADDHQKEFASDVTLNPNHVTLHLVHFVMNNPQLFRIVEEITGCQRISSFAGRVYNIFASDGHHLEWHDDGKAGGRLVGISISLSKDLYSGGIFQLREKSSGGIKFEAESRKLGDAHIFKIAPNLQHRVTRVEGDSPRIAAAGWFFKDGGFLKGLKAFREKSQPKIEV